MTKIYLNLQTNKPNENPYISITKNRFQEENTNISFRSSPLYGFEKDFSFISINEVFTGQILFLFTNQVNDVFYQLKQNTEFIEGQIKAYISHGLASIVLFAPNDFKLSKDKLQNIEYLIGYEQWDVIANKIIDTQINIPELKSTKVIDLDFDLLSHEERFIFSDISSSLNQAYSFADVILKPYLPILDEIKRKVLDFYFRSLFLNDKIDFKKFEIEVKKANSDNIEYAEELLNSYQNIKNTPNKIEQVFIKDEIIQIASVLKNSNLQLFGNIPVLKHGMYQPGKNSLLGIGNHVVGFLSIYLHLRKCFSGFNFDEVFEKKFSEISSPPLLRKPDPNSYNEWYWNFFQSKSLDDYLEKQEVNTTHLIVYFSNRQGFRLTKHSVSAAMQSLYLSYVPTFTLNTLTHELLHAHVRSEIMVEFYPLVESNQGYKLNSDAFSKYLKVFEEDKQNLTIREFIQINFFLIACILKENGNSSTIKRAIKKSHHKDVLTKTLKIWYKEVEEIIVHILDLHYFYNSNPKLYVKAIWISWFSLPFSINNLRDYILRTICAISSLEVTTDRLERFDLAINLIKEELEEIKKCDWVDNGYVDITIDRLQNIHIINDLRFYFVNAFVNLVDITKKFFFSSALKTHLNFDKSLTESDKKENEFTYDFELGIFANRNIESPISAINEINNNNISNFKEISALDKDEIERLSIWLNSLMVTSIK